MNKRLWCKCIFAIMLSIYITFKFTIECSAVDGVSFRNITIEDGLSQATAETMIQDEKGYIWIGTNDGLNRYNGYSFTVFRQEKGNEKSIVNNYIVDLKEDKKGNIWVGTASGVSKLSESGENITNYLPGDTKGNLSHCNVGDILILDDGTVLVGTSDGLNIYDENLDSFKRILKGKLSSELIYSLDQDEKGNLWIGTKNGLNKVDLKTEKIEKYFFNETENSIGENVVYKVYCDKNDYVWVGTSTKGASRINFKTGEITNFFNESWGLDVLPGEHIRNFYRDSNDILWISSSNGLIKYDEISNKFELYKTKVYDKRSLVDDNIFVVMEDKSGMLYVGTFAGISTFDSTNRILHYKNDPFDSRTINDNMVQGIYEDNDGYLWVGTNTKGVNILDKERNNIATITTENNRSLSSNRINYIVGYKDLIFLATNNGLNILDKKSNKIKVYKEEDGLIAKNIRTLFIDDKNQLWIGTTNGFCILNIETNEIINMNSILKGIEGENFYSSAIFQDTDGVYWIGNFVNGGLTKIDSKNNQVVNYKYNINDPHSIIDNSIRTIAEDGYGNLWVGTSGGLCVLDKEANKFKRYTTKNGLPNNTIYGILIDEDNNPWVSTNGGISRYDIIEDKFINLNITDGLQSNEFNGGAYFKTKSGEFFFGGINGINSFYPNEIKENNYIPMVGFDEFSVNGIKVNNIDGEKYSYDKNNISIQVFLPDYKNSKNTRYYYMLEGADSQWRLMDTTEVLFSKLESGNYTFRVKAINGKGIMSKENKVSFRINSPVWMSFPAIVIYALILINIIIREKNKVKELDTLVDLRTEELRNEMEKNNNLFEKVLKLERNKNSYFINLSHELRTPLNVLHSTEQLITKLNDDDVLEKQRLNYYMGIIKRNNTRLLNLINNLIDISRIEHGKYDIKKTEVDIVYLVEEAALSLKEYVESKGITFIIDPEIEEKIIKCDSQDIERCIVNLISNAAKFTAKGGEITVLLEELNDKVRITIKDTGIGIADEYCESIFNRFNQVVDVNAETKGGSGLGLTITKQIVDLHNGRIFVKSKIGQGSSFIIELPIE